MLAQFLRREQVGWFVGCLQTLQDRSRQSWLPRAQSAAAQALYLLCRERLLAPGRRKMQAKEQSALGLCIPAPQAAPAVPGCFWDKNRHAAKRAVSYG